jgi:hypothetical protein
MINITQYYHVKHVGTGLDDVEYTTFTIEPDTSQAIFYKSEWGSESSADLSIDGDIKVKGVSLIDTLQKIQDRLAILQPDPAKLEKFEALRKAYDNYKLLEKLLHEE